MNKLITLPTLLGLIAVIAISSIAIWIHTLPFRPFSLGSNGQFHPIEPVLIAILLSVILNNIFTLPKFIYAGADFSIKKILPVAIMLLGARLNLHDIANVSGNVLTVTICCVALTFLFTLYISCKIGINMRLSMLIAIGTAVCGSAAIIVAAPIIEANETDISVSVTTINLFGICAIFLFPMLGHLLSMNQELYGFWAGASIQAVPQAIAASFSFGQHAGEIGTLTKLIRVLLLAPMILCLSVWYQRKHKKNSANKNSWHSYIPSFIIGFIVVILLNSFGLLPTFSIQSHQINTQETLIHLSTFLISMALTGIGLKIKIKQFVSLGIKPFLSGLIAMLFITCGSYLLITCF